MDKEKIQKNKTLSGRGGVRQNSGRKKGVKIKPETVVFYRRVTHDEAIFLEEQLKIFREKIKSEQL